LTTPRPLLTLLFSEAKSESFKIPVNTTFSYRPSRTSKPAPEPHGPHRHGPAGGGGRRACLLAVACLGLGLAHAQTASNPDTLDERLNLLERQLRDLAAENQALRHELGVTNVYVKPTGPVQELKIGGIIQAQAEFGDQGDARWASDYDRFYVRRARIKAVGRFLEDFDFKVELDLAGALGESTSLRAQLTDGWVNWNHYDFARLKAGQFFPVFGYEKRQDPASLQSIEFSLAGDRLLPERQLGAQWWGDTLEKRIGWALGLFNGMNANNNFNDNDNFMVVPHLEGIPWKGKILGHNSSWSVGLSGLYTDDDRFPLPPDLVPPGQTNVFAGQRYALGVDTQLRAGPFVLWAEYLASHYDPNQFDSYDTQGWYVLVGYDLTKKLQALVKYESFDPDTDVSGDSTDTWTFGLSYAFKGNNLKVYLNYLLLDVPNEPELQHKILTRLQASF
jgi:phosphate-selective porin